jgi:hypothetical protein
MTLLVAWQHFPVAFWAFENIRCFERENCIAANAPAIAKEDSRRDIALETTQAMRHAMLPPNNSSVFR